MKAIRISLLALLALLCAGGILSADTVMGISQAGHASISHPYKVAAIEGDSLALYDYHVSGNTITISRFTVSPAGAVSTPQTFWSYSYSPNWGEVQGWSITFRHKDGHLLAGFPTPARYIAVIRDANSTQLHLFEGFNANYQAYLANENLGFLMDNDQSQARIFRMDFSDDSLVLLQSNPTPSYAPYTYNLMSFADDYLLFVSLEQTPILPDYLYQGTELVHVYPDHWLQAYYFISNNHYVPRVCGQYYFLLVNDGLEKGRGTLLSTLAYVDNGQLQYIPILDSFYPDRNAYLASSAAHSDSTFSCLYYVALDSGMVIEMNFRNYTITNGELVLDPSFPQIDVVDNYPFAICKMNADYLVLASNPRFTLVDYTDNSIRHFYFPLEAYQGSAWKLHHSDPYFYVLRPDKVHVFALEEYTAVDDETLPPAEPSINIHPNPFSASCQIRIEGAAPPSLDIYNLKGQRVRTLSASGEDGFAWDGRDQRGQPVATGVYLVRVVDRGHSYSRKLLLCK